MASTLKPVDALDMAKKFIKNMPVEQVQGRILDSVNKIMWMHSPWRWTLGALTAIPLVSNTQDYAIAALPATYLFAIDAYSTDGGTPRSLGVEPILPANGIIGLPSKIAITGTAGVAGSLRVYPKPGTLSTTPPSVYAIYKKLAPTITLRNMHTAGTQVFDDEWFWVYESGVLWMAYLYADDQRAGTAQVETGSGKIVFTGQRAIFEANMQIMAARESLLTVDTPRVPDQKGV